MDKVLTADDKKYIYNLLADQFIQGLKIKYLGKYEQKVLANKVLDNIEKSKTWGEVIGFVEEFSKKYSFFSPVTPILKAKINQGSEAQIISKLQSYIKSSPQAQ